MHPVKRGPLAARAVRLALLALAGLACLPAQAQFQGAASGANLRYTLEDLSPADGIAPSAVFGTGRADFRVGLATWPDGQPVQSQYTEKTVTAPWTINHEAANGHTGTAWLGTGNVAAAMLAPEGEMRIVADQRVNGLQEFRLAPHTSITFLLDAAVDLQIDLSYAAIQDASASVDLYVDGVTWLPQPPGQSQGRGLGGAVSNDPESRHPGFVPSVRQYDTLRGVWTNDTDQWADGRLHVNATLFAWALSGENVSPVPEPGQWAMLGIGVGLLGWRLRRSKRPA